MIVIGLTGSIGAGKSFVARQFKKEGARLFDADKEVHRLLQPGGSAEGKVKEAFPQSIHCGKISRKILGDIVFNDSRKLKKLEAILHPIIREKECAFIKRERHKKTTLAVLDIPLLFETGAESLCDVVVMVRAKNRLQQQRVLKREHMDAKKLATIKQLQWSEAEKEKQADYIVQTGLDKRFVAKQVRDIVRKLRESRTE